MKKFVLTALLGCAVTVAMPGSAQVKMTKEQMMFYTSDWKGERFADGRPRVPDNLLERALDIFEAAYRPDHPEVATTLNNLAQALHDQGHGDQALMVLGRGRVVEGTGEPVDGAEGS